MTKKRQKVETENLKIAQALSSNTNKLTAKLNLFARLLLSF